MKEKLIASFLAALTMLTPIVSAATQLGNYPTFLTKVGALDAYVVVGAAAATDDVVGAVNLAVRLAEVSKTSTTVSCPGAVAETVDGTLKEVKYPGAIAGTDTTNQLPIEVKTFHFSGLKRGEVSYRGTDYSYYELVKLDTGSTNFGLTNKKGAPVNGTIRMVVQTGKIVYKWRLAENISSTYWGNFTDASPNYDYPFKLKLFGQEFQIVATPAITQVRMLSGAVGTADPDSPVKSGDYSVYCTDAADNSWASLTIKDATGAIVAGPQVVSQADTWEVTLGGTGYKVKLLRAYASTATAKVHAKVAFGTEVDKTYDGGSESLFPGTTDWRIGAEITAAGKLQLNDNITVSYYPSETKYLKLGESVKAPNGYFEISPRDYNTDQFAEVTFEPVTGVTAYASTATGAASMLSANGLMISTDISGTIGTYDKLYVLFNDTAAVIAYYDPTSKKNLWDCSGCAPTEAGFKSKAFDLIYGGVGEVTYKLVIDTNTSKLGGGTSSSSGTASILNITVYNSSMLGGVDLDFMNSTAYAAGVNPSIKLGTTDATADAKDVTGDLEGATQDIGTMSVGDVVTDTGIIVKVPKTYADANKVILEVPAKSLKVKVAFGKITAAAAAAGQCVQETLTPVTSAVAVLDSEVTAAHKAKNLVLVGGPCKNTLVADLAAAGKFPYTCVGWPGRDFGLIKAIDDAFTTGEVVLVVAGTRAADTRVACSVLQQYDTLLAGQTASAVEATSATAAGITAV